MISISQYNQFVRDYDAGKYPHERFGQAFMNHALPETDYEVKGTLFYQTDRKKAEDLIWKVYIDLSLQNTLYDYE